jgi:hypothetical protein
MANRKLVLAHKYLTAPQVRKRLSLSRFQLDLRIKNQILPSPTFIDPDTGVRYFDEQWVRTAKAILDNSARSKELAIVGE